MIDGSDDDTLAFINTFHPPYPLIAAVQANRGPASARNHAITLAHGEIVLFLDDDVVPERGTIAHHVAIHQNSDDAVVMGPMLPPSGRRMPPWLEWEALMLQKQYRAMAAGQFTPTPRQFYTANASVRRRHVIRAGGFDERYRRAEDVDLAYRLAALGLCFHFEPRAVVTHEPDRTLAGWLRVAREYGRFDVLAGMERPAVLRYSYDEWHRRHLLNRALPRLCVGHARRERLIILAARPLLALRLPERMAPLQRLACSALFNVQYWQGVADASGQGERIWSGAAAALAGARARRGREAS